MTMLGMAVLALQDWFLCKIGRPRSFEKDGHEVCWSCFSQHSSN